jgi:alkylated DNA repair dioxygenase AlkB
MPLGDDLVLPNSNNWDALGLKYIPNFIGKSEEQTLISHIRCLSWDQVSLFGQIAKRRVMHFGLNYDYSSKKVSPTLPPPNFLSELIVRAAGLVQESGKSIAELLITEYPMGAGINWHRDALIFNDVIGLSLNSDCIIQFRRRSNNKEKIKLRLERYSAYVLTRAIRWDWEHRIAPVKTLRYSITLRSLN